jgi:hypothetical protein
MGRADDIASIDGAMVSPMLIQNTLCQLSNVRYAAVVRDRKANLWVAAVVPWPDSQVADNYRDGCLSCRELPNIMSPVQKFRGNGSVSEEPRRSHRAVHRRKVEAQLAGMFGLEGTHL